ncbi:hypothetical protein CONCODRAFT_12355 [Conidiobolus coronatus NRRL 28638]|uniref:Galactose oxidase n=1 Tax=Conidiobolus coronatus (strain ATCC 28846 / CBS 209.66 / NRRL 28638) TaxID=796925 RepID=A0A137NT63_CONC2|nr:hypothetical protein CONCODRAFT_12355 [Conidiobolus coronatus NRRL 28638]|eukprot:KXN65931.1 hypothetical protein CONCODRAFT_12355 [Conidiobolus coronatus NRRL 28638]
MLFLLLYIYSLFADRSIYDNLDDRICSGIFKNGKYYVFSPAEDSRNISNIYIYDLKDGPIAEINKTVVNITDTPFGYTPHFLNFNQDLNGIPIELLMIENYIDLNVTDSKLDESKWMARFINDKKFEFSPSFIKFPSYINFPKGGFSQNIVNINNNPVMYIIGGYAYSGQLNSTILTSSVFKYDFNSNSWSDLSEDSKSLLPPIANHRSLQVNNTLFILNGVSPNTTDTNHPQAYSTKKLMKINAINKMYKFDLLTEKWDAIPLKTNLDAGTYGDGIMVGASYDYYNGNIITYGPARVTNIYRFDPHFGILDLASYEWRWNTIKADYGVDNNLKLGFHQTLVIRDQLLLFHGFSNQINSHSIYVINLKDLKFQSNLDYSGNINSEFGSPIYKYILIALGIILGVMLLLLLIYLLKRYRKKRIREMNNSKQLKVVWASSENVTGTYTPGDGFVDDYQRREIFSLENNEISDNQILRSNLVHEDLTRSTLIGTELYTKALPNISTLKSTKYN